VAEKRGRGRIEQLSVAIQTIAKRMDAQFVLDEEKVESFIKANRLREEEEDSNLTSLNT
jgi:hypothetical protein